MGTVTATQGSIARSLVVIAALAILAPGAALPAQPLSSPTAAIFRMTSLDSSAGRDSRPMRRLYPAATVGLGSALALGFVGYLIAGPCTSKCDILSMNHVVGGALIGEIFGSAYGAALPRGRGLCTRGERYGMGLGGAFIGALAAMGLAQIPPGRIGILAVVPLGSVIFLKGC